LKKANAIRPLKAAIERRTGLQNWVWWILPFITIAGWWYPVLGYFIPFCMVAGLSIAVKRGRAWCDWLCPRGSFLDVVLSPISLKKKIPDILRNTGFRIAVLSFLMLVLLTQLPRYWPSIAGMGLVFVTMLTVTTVLGIILGILFHPRSWCTICPIGTMSNWIGRGKSPLMIDSRCNECKACDTICPIQINRWQYHPSEGEAAVIPEWDCLKCGLCISACKREALTLRKP